MAVLSDKEIFTLLGSGSLVVSPIDAAQQIQPASIDLRLGEKGRVLCAGSVSACDGKKVSPSGEDVDLSEEFVLEPGMLLTAATLESITIPQECNAKVYNKNGLLMLGIDVAVGYINPGYSGNMPIAIRNNGPLSITIKSGMQICQLELSRLSSVSTRAYPDRYDMKNAEEYIEASGLLASANTDLGDGPISKYLKEQIEHLSGGK